LVKALAQPGLAAWLQCGGRFEIHGWARRGPRGKRKLWGVSRRPVTAQDLPHAAEPDGVFVAAGI
jgi:hypothetical protein